MKKVKFGIIGCGMIANVHAAAIKEIDKAELVGVYDVNSKSALSFSEKHGVKAFERYADILSSDIDVLCVCTPSGHHAENAVKALTAGKHVVLEKPMALTIDDVNAVIEAEKRSGKLLTVVSQLRFSPDVARVKKLVEGGALGKITMCNLFMNYYRSPEYYSSSAWKGTREHDGGILMNQGIHGVDLVLHIMGKISYAQSRTATFSHSIETEDTVVSTVTFECGALGVVEASTCAYPGFDRRIEIYGERGYVFMKENAIEKMMIDGEMINVSPKSGVSTSSDPSSLDISLHRAQIMNVINALNGDEPLLVTSADGKCAVEAIKMIYGK